MYHSTNGVGTVGTLFRTTGITAYLSNGGTLEHAQQIAGHASPKTTKLYDRTADTVTVDEDRAHRDLKRGRRKDAGRQPTALAAELGRVGLARSLDLQRDDDAPAAGRTMRSTSTTASPPASATGRTVHDLSARGVGLRVLAGDGAQIDTTTAAGRLVFGIFAALAEFERELIRERTVAGLKAARARGCKGGRKFALSKAPDAARPGRDGAPRHVRHRAGDAGDAPSGTSDRRASCDAGGAKRRISPPPANNPGKLDDFEVAALVHAGVMKKVHLRHPRYRDEAACGQPSTPPS